MKISTVAVIGGGLMGRQIALNAALHSHDVYITDSNADVLENIEKWKNEYLQQRIDKGRLTPKQVEDTKSRFHIVKTIPDAVKDSDLIIEAVAELQNVKEDVLRQVSEVARKDAIIATNSSFMVSSTFAGVVDNPSRLCNLHYFNPALVMKLTEIVKGPHTSDETVQAVYDFSLQTGKTPVIINKEIDGFIVNRIIDAIYREAYSLVEQGYCSYKDLDIACENGLGHPMGPYRLNDLTGIDLSYDVLRSRYEKTGEKPAGYDIIKEFYDKGRYGRKTGHGFYDYKEI